GIAEAEKITGVKVFHAGTKKVDSQLITSGGRVLGVTALGETIADAQKAAYQAVECIQFDGAYYRKDIADKAIQNIAT
ncbi:MAG: phosphoribosylamine--glycine ligase, partial [Planctomycetes bacterium]|nr:phosphoribosylamine--glycine ligase [Planctomycetota bacterium]